LAKRPLEVVRENALRDCGEPTRIQILSALLTTDPAKEHEFEAVIAQLEISTAVSLDGHSFPIWAES
jgi:hypothetical protein